MMLSVLQWQVFNSSQSFDSNTHCLTIVWSSGVVRHFTRICLANSRQGLQQVPRLLDAALHAIGINYRSVTVFSLLCPPHLSSLGLHLILPMACSAFNNRRPAALSMAKRTWEAACEHEQLAFLSHVHQSAAALGYHVQRQVPRTIDAWRTETSKQKKKKKKRLSIQLQGPCHWQGGAGFKWKKVWWMQSRLFVFFKGFHDHIMFHHCI